MQRVFLKACLSLAMVGGLLLFAEGRTSADPFRHWLLLIGGPVQLGMSLNLLIRKTPLPPQNPQPLDRQGAIRLMAAITALVVPWIIILTAIFLSRRHGLG